MREYKIITDIPEVTFNVLGVSEEEAREIADQILGACEITGVQEVDGNEV
jgi:hypothetical protein